MPRPSKTVGVPGQGAIERWYNDPRIRLAIWIIEMEEVSNLLGRLDIAVLPVPAEAIDADGFLLPDFSANDATHANAAYSELVLRQIERLGIGQETTP